ncbi:MAG: glycoside hydrolase family 9 protein, partial [Fibrobacter sp.]|nr:glycoside hydrolase family 9 protein [Fibrobacter sp.]
TKAAGWSSPAYNGNNEAYDDLALAAIALHYATYEKTGKMDYFNDAVEETSFGDQSSYVGNGYFNGGWMAYTRDGMYKSLKNTSWANAHTYALYAFYKLLLKDDATALKYGISTESKKSESKETRLWYAENVGLALGGNLSYFSYYGAASEGTISIQAGGLGGASITYDALWYSLMTDQDWIYNRYQAGNIFEVLAYAEVTADLENIELPQAQTVRSWQSAKMKQLAINQLNYMFGVNPWDLSFMAGVGDKNDAHPHHRMNPEGQNMMAGVQYKYRPIVGAIYGGMRPGAKNSIEPQSKSWEDYRLTETCVDGSATLLGALQILSKSTDKTLAPTKSDVNVITIDKDNVLIEVKQDVAGPATIYYGTTESKKMETAATDETSKKSHYITLNDLKSSTEYSFYVVVANGTSGKKLEKYKDSKKTAFTFKTTKEAREKAVITDVGVLNITGDSTDVVWKTTNGKFASKVYWDTLDVAADKMQWNTGDGNADRSGILTEEHLVRIGGLRVNKTYYYAVESDGVIVKTDADKKSLKFTTAVPTRMDLSGYMYDYGGLDNMHIEIANGESFDLDNLTLRMYFTAKPEEVEECATMIDADICRNYDVAGFSGRCKNDLELRDLLRSAKPVKLEKTLNEKEGSYTWYYPIPLGSTTISAYSKIWIDLSISSGVPGADGCKPLRSAAAKKFSAKSNDWSFMPHRIASGDPADYDGMLLEEKDYGDYASHLNTNPYIVVTQGDLVIWGYGPTEAERPTLAPDKRYVLDFTGATMYKTSSKLQVYVPNSGAKTVALFNMRGAKVLQETFNGNNHDVDLSRLPRGNYVARLISQRKVIMTRQFGIQ